MERLRNMHIFVEVAKASSFRRAGEILGLPNSTVSRRIADLEREIGLRLFNRTTRIVVLTEAGQAYFERCRRIVDEARLAHEELAERLENPSGLIRISLPVDFGVVFLSAQLAEFSRAYPTIRFDLELTARRADLVADPVDVAICTGRPPDSSLIARPIATLPSGLFASPDYLAGRGRPVSPHDLAVHDCLRIDDRPWSLSALMSHEAVEIAVAGRFTANNIGMLRQLAINGMGIAWMARELARPDVSAQRLEPVLADWAPEPVRIYALTATRLLPAKIRVFLDFLTKNLGS